MPNMSGGRTDSLLCANGLKPVSFIPGIPLGLKRSEVFLEGLVLGIILDGWNGEPRSKPGVPNGAVVSSPVSPSLSSLEVVAIKSTNGRTC